MKSLPYLLGHVEGLLGVLKVRLGNDTPKRKELIESEKYQLVLDMFDSIFVLLGEIVTRVDNGHRLDDEGDES